MVLLDKGYIPIEQDLDIDGVDIIRDEISLS